MASRDADRLVCSTLRTLVEEAVKRNLAEGILLSGGLDTSIIAFIASKHTLPKAVTVAFEGASAPDVKYARLVAQRLKLKHLLHYFGEAELFEAVEAVVKAVRSFEPMEVRNDVAIYVALKVAKENRLSTVMTGDGCDELFAGYSFLFNLSKEQLDLALTKLCGVMAFVSVPLAASLGMEAKLPFLDGDLRSFAVNLDSQYKVRRGGGRVWGKWILRKAFENILPEQITWRVKVPIERGSGTTALPAFFNSMISTTTFNEEKKKFMDEDRVMIRDKEQLFYYRAYRSVIGVPKPLDMEGKICPQCNSNVNDKATYCRTCGAYPI